MNTTPLAAGGAESLVLGAPAGANSSQWESAPRSNPVGEGWRSLAVWVIALLVLVLGFYGRG